MYIAQSNIEKLPSIVDDCNDDYVMASLIARDLADKRTIYSPHWTVEEIDDFYNAYDGCFFQ